MTKTSSGRHRQTSARGVQSENEKRRGKLTSPMAVSYAAARRSVERSRIGLPDVCA